LFSPEVFQFVLNITVWVIVVIVVNIVVVVVGVIVVVGVVGVGVVVVALVVVDWGSATVAAGTGLSFAGHWAMVVVLGEVWQDV